MKKWYKNFRRWLFSVKQGDQAILIYTMGKVGSASIKANLKEQYPFVPAFHIHFLSDYWLKEVLPKENAFFQDNIKDAEHVFAFLNSHPKTRLKIITLMRDPLTRDISDIFQNWKGRSNAASINDFSFEELKSAFDKDDHAYTLSWFDTEFKNYLNFDIYSENFDKEKGYSIYSTPNADILCMQLEKMNVCMEEASLAFLGYRISLNKTTNLSEDKEGKELYKQMIGKYKASDEKLKLVYQSKMVQHFYSEADIQKMISRWKF